MSDEDALLTAIIANPDEDTPRLVYADWLQENGDAERAEFIRLQCRIAVSDPDEIDPADARREAELEDRNRGGWLTGLPRFPGVHWSFRRGFAEHLKAPGEIVLEWYEGFARVPWLRSLHLHDVRTRDVRTFASRPWNPSWAELELELQFELAISDSFDSTPCIVAIAGCPQARQLQRLRLTWFRLNSISIRVLAQSPHLEQLQLLRVARHGSGGDLAPLRQRFGDRFTGL